MTTPPIPGRHLLLAAAVAGGCSSSGYEGTSVGNPSVVAFSTAEGGDVTLTSGEIGVGELLLLGLNGTEERVPVSQTLDSLQGSTIDLPGGAWREVIIRLDSTLLYEGETSTGFHAALELDVPDVRLHPSADSLSSDGETFVMELAFPGWLAFDYAEFDRDRDVDVAPGSLIHDRLVNAVRDRSALFPDPGMDGRVSDEERLDPRGAGRDRPPPPADDPRPPPKP